MTTFDIIRELQKDYANTTKIVPFFYLFYINKDEITFN